MWLSWLALIISAVGGLCLALMRVSSFRLLRVAALLYNQFFVSVPTLIVLFFCYYGLPSISALEISTFAAATTALSLHGSAMVSEVIRAGIVSVDRGQWEAAQSSGLRYWQVMRLVVVPQAIRVALPPFVNVYIRLVKESSIAALIGYVELTQTALLIRESRRAGLAVVGVAALLYFAINFAISLAGRTLERRQRAIG